jgi:hypothetical protein
VRASSLAQDVATRKWGWATGHSLGDDPEGKTLGIIGFGRIGQSLARKCNLAFGMKIIYYDVRHIVQSAVPTAVKVSMEELLQVRLMLGMSCVNAYRPRSVVRRGLQTSDVVTVHVDLNERTHHMLSTEQFAMMKDGVYVINAARGPIVDEEALATALEEGKVAGAGLDVRPTSYVPLAATWWTERSDYLFLLLSGVRGRAAGPAAAFGQGRQCDVPAAHRCRHHARKTAQHGTVLPERAGGSGARASPSHAGERAGESKDWGETTDCFPASEGHQPGCLCSGCCETKAVMLSLIVVYGTLNAFK